MVHIFYSDDYQNHSFSERVALKNNIGDVYLHDLNLP